MPDDEDLSDREPPYEVGYKRPPKDRQWRKGESGNKRGRPRGSKSLKAIVREQAARTIDAKSGGRNQRVALAEALVMRILRDGVSGRAAAMQSALKLLERYGDHEEAAVEPPVEQDLSDWDGWEITLAYWVSCRVAGTPENQWEMVEEHLRKRIESYASSTILRQSLGKIYQEELADMAEEHQQFQRLAKLYLERRGEIIERVCGPTERTG